MNIYRYYTMRNKLGISQNKLKKQLLIKNCNCYLCNKNFSDKKHILELEHKIPVMLCGSVISTDNLALVCPNCHREKTIIDKAIIKSLKVMHILKGNYEMTSILNKKEIEDYYLRFFPLIKEKIKIDSDWDYKPNYIYLEQNKEVENGDKN